MNVFGRQCLRIFTHDAIHQNNFCALGRTLTYKSALSLEKLYPKSNIQIYTPTFTPEDPNTKFSGYIPINELDITYSRSSGAGGQHVNRVNSKVDLRFNVKNASWISEEIKEKLLEQHKNKISKEGCLIIKSELTRSQQLNLADALEKLREMIRKTLEPPPQVSEESLEVKRKRLLNAARKRVFAKRMRSEIKRNRQAPVDF